MARYAELVDAGDFAGLGEMFADATLGGEGDNAVHGGPAVEEVFRVAFQAVPELPLPPIVAGRYRDRFVRRGAAWCFAERRFTTGLVGDVSRHLRAGARSLGS